MDNKIIALIIIIILLVIGGLYLFATQNNSNTTLNTTNNSTINTTNNTNQVTSNGTNLNNATTQNNNNTNVKVSASQARQIAIGASKDLTGETDTAGTPTLIKWTTNTKHTWVWKVPLTNTATGKTDLMYIDATTGEVIMNE